MNYTRGTVRDTYLTSLQGEVVATYPELVAAFGEPDHPDDGKVDVRWVLRFADGTVAAVYNWKNGPRYGGPPVTARAVWNVGGDRAEAVQRVEEVLRRGLTSA